MIKITMFESKYHVKCAKILVKVYEMIKKLSNRVRWSFETCSNRRGESGVNDDNSLTESCLLNELLNIVKVLVTDNLAITSKLDLFLNDYKIIKGILSTTSMKQSRPRPMSPTTSDHGESSTEENIVTRPTSLVGLNDVSNSKKCEETHHSAPKLKPTYAKVVSDYILRIQF